jgi:prepilin-type N-terminal cleavage/methylation domain-containing protein
MPFKDKYRQSAQFQNRVGNNQDGFSLIELMIAMTIILVLMAAAMSLYGAAFSTRSRETRRTDALSSARAAIDSISREIANSGYGLQDSELLPYNGIVWNESNSQRIHFRSNFQNNEDSSNPSKPPLATDDPGEDVAYYLDNTTQSILRFDRYSNPQTSVIVNRISSLTFEYFNNVGTNSTATQVTVPTKDTARIRITVEVMLENVVGQPNNQRVRLTSEVALRNSRYMLNQY